MTTDEYGPPLAVPAALLRAPSAEILLAVASGLTTVRVEPRAEWSGIPTQRPASPTPSRTGAAVSLPKRPC